MRPDLSVVVPVYQCADCLRALHRRVTATLSNLGVSYELVFVDDRSPGEDWTVLKELASEDACVGVVRLSRNFGQHAAITAGLAETTGRWVVVMDCDLEDRPEEIPRLWTKAQEGHDVVFAARKTRPHSWFRRLAARAYARLLNVAVSANLNPQFGNFSIISRQVCDEYLRFRDRDRQYLMILYWLGFKTASIDVRQDPRHSGKSAYSFAGLVRFALDGLFFQTAILLRWIVYAGFAVSTLGALLAVYFVVSFFFHDPFPGWTSLGVLFLLVGGFIIVTLGVTGLYVGRIYEQVKERPLYVVDYRIGVGSHERAPTRSSCELVEP